jgi:iron complex transport system permease protein
MRAKIVNIVLAVAATALTFYSLTTGDLALSLDRVFLALFGQADRQAELAVEVLRLPRIGTALLVGAALAVAGAILQRLTGNPLGSPDVVGLTTGAATGAVIAILIADASLTQASFAAQAGGLLTAAAAYFLAYRGGVSGYRLILVGIGLSSMLLALNSYLITRASAQDAASAQIWIIGSLNDRQPEDMLWLTVSIGLLLAGALLLGKRLSLMEMGDDLATGLGVPVGRSRLMLIGICVALTSIATAATGPIAFIALVAPQISRRLTRSAGAGLTAAALTGALLLGVSDLLAQQLPSRMPVGVLTGLVGGVYLARLLVKEWRRSTS